MEYNSGLDNNYSDIIANSLGFATELCRSSNVHAMTLERATNVLPLNIFVPYIYNVTELANLIYRLPPTREFNTDTGASSSSSMSSSSSSTSLLKLCARKRCSKQAEGLQLIRSRVSSN